MKLQSFSRFSVLILLILFSIAGNTLAAETWVVDPNTGTKIGWSSTDWVLLKASWSGPAVGGKAEGKGELDAKIRYKDGTTIQAKGEAEMLAGLLTAKQASNIPTEILMMVLINKVSAPDKESIVSKMALTMMATGKMANMTEKEF